MPEDKHVVAKGFWRKTLTRLPELLQGKPLAEFRRQRCPRWLYFRLRHIRLGGQSYWDCFVSANQEHTRNKPGTRKRDQDFQKKGCQLSKSSPRYERELTNVSVSSPPVDDTAKSMLRGDGSGDSPVGWGPLEGTGVLMMRTFSMAGDRDRWSLPAHDPELISLKPHSFWYYIPVLSQLFSVMYPLGNILFIKYPCITMRNVPIVIVLLR